MTAAAIYSLIGTAKLNKRDVLMCPSGGFSSLNLVFGNLIPCAPAVK
jgi:hypothetical protein